MLSFVVAALAAIFANDASANGLKRMYVLDCGYLIAKDQSRWTPGVNVGQSRELSNNCYLLQHERGTLLWETGVPDSVSGQRDGVTSPNGASSGSVTRRCRVNSRASVSRRDRKLSRA